MTAPRITVVPVEPGFAEIKADGKHVVGVAVQNYWGDWEVRLFPRPSHRSVVAVPPFTLPSLRAVRADVKGRDQWWSGTAAAG